MKRKQELEDLIQEIEQLKGKLVELSDEELVQVTGGNAKTYDCKPNASLCPEIRLEKTDT